MKIKLEQYIVHLKGNRHYKVVVMPRLDKMWCYFNGGEGTYDIDGDKKAMEMLGIAFAVVIRDPQAILYFQIAKYDSFNAVLTRAAVADFKPSTWYDIKPLLKKKNRVKNYIFDYNSKKLDDYYINREIKKQYKDCVFKQTELGNTVFMKFSIYDYYYFHSRIQSAIRSMNGEARYTECWGLGFLLSESLLEEVC